MDKKQPDVNARRFKDKGIFGERLYALRKIKKLSQRQLSNATHVSHVTISQWESSDSHPNGAHLMALCLALDCTPNYLMYGIGADSSSSPEQPESLCIRHPVLSGLQAARWTDLLPVATPEDIEVWIESDAPLYGDGFWMRITNDAMESPVGLSIPEGAYVLFDTARKVLTGDLVIVGMRGHSEPLFRKLVTDAGTQYLKALNPIWPMSILNEHVDSICVAVEAKILIVHDMTPVK
ncbi:S24 family peptidase [Rouxiella sp. T17]|uniref:helix-turn-helix domain-containing protein n=1 Tax=Rouxiella sp. T17 TaxID=3085684 RepID=UPI002FC59702